MERPREEVVTAAVQRSHPVDGVGLRFAEDDHRHIAVPRPARLDRIRIRQQDEIGPCLVVDDLEAVLRQMSFEKATRIGLRIGE